MSTQDKLDMVIELFRRGLLCQCDEYDDIYDEDRNIIDQELRHIRDCEGRAKAQAMLNETEQEVNE